MENKKLPEVRFSRFTGDWEQRNLGEIINISSASRVHKNEWTSKGVRFLRSSDVMSTHNGNINRKVFISNELYENLAKKSGKVKKGDVLVTGGGSVGMPYLVNDDEPLYFKDADLIWLKNSGIISGYFLYTYFISPIFRKYIKSISHVGTISHYTIEQAKETPITLPKEEQQNKIGYFFKQLDDIIALHQQELDTLKQTKQGFLQKMFPKEGETVPGVRFPGFSEEWKQQMLGNNAIIKGRLGWKSLKQEEYTEQGPNMIAGKHITAGKIDWEKVDHIPMWRYEESPEIMLEEGDVIFSKDGSLGNPAIITELKQPSTINSTMMLVRTDDTIDSSFFYQIMISDIFKKLIYLKVSGSSIPHLFQADMNEFKFFSPSIEEQQKIGAFFKQLDDTIALQQRELDALKETKKAFLQKMFI